MNSISIESILLWHIFIYKLKVFEIKKSFYEGFFDEELCAGYPADIYDDDKQQWITKGGKDSCTGDSGGGLICEHHGKAVLMGTVSHGKECAKDGYPGVYSQIDKQKNWIDNGKLG